MISGPPAIPSFRGTGMPGIAIGSEPNTIPIIIPMNIVAMFGASRRRMELPIMSDTRFTASSGPTTIMRSPTRRWSDALAKMSIPWRVTRVTLTP